MEFQRSRIGDEAVGLIGLEGTYRKNSGLILIDH